jgi:MoxR-like ATPase
MKPSEYAQLIKACHEAKISLIALGKPGIGKTAIVYQVAKEMNIEVYYLPFSVLADRTDFRIGIPKENVMHFLYSEELPQENKEGILLLDDITDADKFLLSCAKSLLFERKLSKYQVPENISVIATGNPLEAGGLIHIDEKAKTRVLFITVETDIDDWLEWARRKGISDFIRAFITYKPEALYYTHDVIIAPRNWEIIDKLLKTSKNINLLSEILGSLFPLFKNFYNSFETAKNKLDILKDILEGKDYQKKLPKKEEDKFSILNALLWYISDKKLTKEQVINLLRLCKDENFLYEYRIFFLKELTLKKPNIVNLPETLQAITYLQGGEDEE